MTKFYVDSCIYLNLWNKEGDLRFGKPYWKIAKDFFEKYDSDENTIYYSNFLIKEMQHVYGKINFQDKKNLFKDSNNFKEVKVFSKDIEKARFIEYEIKSEISFYDIIHLVLAEKTNSILITRDKLLIKIARKYGILAKKPEEL